MHSLLVPSLSMDSMATCSSEYPCLENTSSQTSQPSDVMSCECTEDVLDVSSQHTQEVAEGSNRQGAEKRSSWSGKKRAYDEVEESEKEKAQATGIKAVPCLTSQGSSVRLSISTDGAVRVKTTGQETPSPPKSSTLKPLRALQRSRSAADSVDVVGEGKPRTLRGAFGRSRDARIWEFYCDSDARDALSAHADSEISGSAIGAINFIRSQSRKGSSKTTRERQPMVARTSAEKARVASGLQGQKPKISRAMSSMARMQNGGIKVQDNGRLSLTHARSPSGDSDKENWAPGTRSSTDSLRRQQGGSTAALPRRVLVENDQIPTLAALTASQTRSRSTQGAGLIGEESDNIVSRPEALVNEGSEGEDLDCIQGLLSLSQGAWR